MKVAWICYYPPHLIPDRPKLRNDLSRHPVPWVSLQAPLVAKTPGVELHVIRVGKGYEGDDHFTHNGIHFHFLTLPRLPRVLSWYQVDRVRIHRCLREIRPDLVHGFGTESSYGYAAVTSSYPSVVMMQGVNSEIYRSLGSLRWQRPHLIVPLIIERFTVRKCRNFICETNFASEFVRRLNPAAKVHMLRTPVRHEFFAIKRNPSPDNKPVLLFVGSVIPEKGIEILLNSFAETLKDFPAADLRVIGHFTPSYARVLESLMIRLGIAKQVTMYGYLNVKELARHFAEATLLVLPSFMDTAPNVIAEAQVAGVPVVATAVGGIPEMTEPDVTGILVQPRSVPSLTAGLLRLLRDSATAKSMAAAAQERVMSHYEPDKQVKKLLGVYRAILQE
jgi:glycosyltransferase involved in cell wall biosynthesis